MKEVTIELSPKEAQGLTFGNEIKATITGTIKSISEQKNYAIVDGKEEKEEPETIICVSVLPSNIRIGGKEVIKGDDRIKDEFSKDYEKYLGLKKSMEVKGKRARANGLSVTGDN